MSDDVGGSPQPCAGGGGHDKQDGGRAESGARGRLRESFSDGDRVSTAVGGALFAARASSLIFFTPRAGGESLPTALRRLRKYSMALGLLFLVSGFAALASFFFFALGAPGPNETFPLPATLLLTLVGLGMECICIASVFLHIEGRWEEMMTATAAAVEEEG